jgi:hypothetical protein
LIALWRGVFKNVAGVSHGRFVDNTVIAGVKLVGGGGEIDMLAVPYRGPTNPRTSRWEMAGGNLRDADDVPLSTNTGSDSVVSGMRGKPCAIEEIEGNLLGK